MEQNLLFIAAILCTAGALVVLVWRWWRSRNSEDNEPNWWEEKRDDD